MKPLKFVEGGSRGENGIIAQWGRGEDMQSAVTVYRPDAALRLAEQGGTFPRWVDDWVVGHIGG